MIRSKHLHMFDIGVMVVWPLIAFFTASSIDVGILGSIFLFFISPAIYLSFVAPKYIQRALVFSFITAVPFGIIFDYIMQVTGGWAVAGAAIPFKLFTYVTPEQIIWLFFFSYFVIMFYEVFFDRHEKDCLCTRCSHVSPTRKKYLVFILSVLLGTFVTFFFLAPEVLAIEMFYAKGGLIFLLIPILLVAHKIHSMQRKLLLTGLYFFYHGLTYQISALKLGLWNYPDASQFIGWVNIFGVSFPLEELLFWITFGAIGVVAWYEYFHDDAS